MEQYLKAHSDQPPHRHTDSEVAAYPQEIGRTSQINDWQYRQLVATLEVLFVEVLELPWATAFSTGILDQICKDHDPIIKPLIAEIRRRAYSIRTEQACEQWVCCFIAFCDSRDPHELGAVEVKSFLEHLAVQDNVAASTQNQAPGLLPNKSEWE